MRRLLPPTGVGRRRGWLDGRRGAAAPSSTGLPGPRQLAPTGSGQVCTCFSLQPPKAAQCDPSRGQCRWPAGCALCQPHPGSGLPDGITLKAAITVHGQSLLRAGHPHANLPDPPLSSSWSQREPKLVTDPGQAGLRKCPPGATHANKTRWSLIPRVARSHSRVHTLPDLHS